MSRSRAMRRIWTIVKRQDEETEPGRPLLSRRDILKASGVAIGALLLNRSLWAKPWRGSGSPRIGIVGAGIAGLSAALSLQDNGLPCSIYEVSGRVGGRMHSNRTYWQQGQTSEWCGEFIDSDHIVMRRLARRFGLPLSDVVAAEPPNSMDTNYFLGGYYTDAELAHDVKRVTPIIAEQNKEIGQAVLYNHYNPAG
jgi:monoamine oxidase